LSLNRINSLLEYEPGKFLAGSDNGDIDVVTDQGIMKINTSHDLSNTSIKYFIKARNGDIWVATYAGVLRIGNGSEDLFSTDNGFPENQARVLLEDRHGNIWVGYKNSGLICIHEDLSFTPYNKENGLGSDYVLSLDELPDGTILVGTHSGGLNFIKNNKIVETLFPLKLAAGVLIFNTSMVNDSDIWLSTNVGIFLLKDGKFYQITEHDGLGAETIFDLVEDSMGNFWMSSNAGIVKIEKDQLYEFISGNIQKVEGVVYDNNDGMITRECTAASRILLTTAGELWFPTFGGIVIVEPDIIFINPVKPDVYITKVQLDGAEWIDCVDGMIFDAGYDRYSFDYTALSFSAPAKVRFKYKLTGFDGDWVEAGVKRQVTYTNLSPGKYNFSVIACNNDGLWNTQGASMNFIIKPYIYETVWFYILIFALVAGLFYLRLHTIRKHNEQLQKLNAELDSFVYSTSHDLRAPLMSVLGLVNIAKLDEDKSRIKEYLNNIEKSIKKLDNFISDIIDYSRNSRLEVTLEKVDIRSVLEGIIESLAYLDPENKIEKTIEIDNKAKPIRTDSRRLAIVLSNIISNSFRYFRPYIDNPYIIINVFPDKGGILIRIADNGKGIADEHISKIFDMFYRASESSNGSGLGLYIMKETLAKLKGAVSVESKLDKGTTFTLRIPTL